MSMYGKILAEKRDAAKACPKCHRIMKSAVVKGKNVWVCVYCGVKREAGNEQIH